MKYHVRLIILALCAMASLFTACTKETIETTVSAPANNLDTATDRSGSLTVMATGSGSALALWSPFGDGNYHVTVQDMTNRGTYVIINDVIVMYQPVSGLVPGHNYRFSVNSGQEFIIIDVVWGG